MPGRSDHSRSPLPPDRFPPLGGGTVSGEGWGQELDGNGCGCNGRENYVHADTAITVPGSRIVADIRARRDAAVWHLTTRIDDDAYPFSPFLWITVAWPDERCELCARRIPDGMDAAFDEEHYACAHLGCARAWLAREAEAIRRREEKAA